MDNEMLGNVNTEEFITLILMWAGYGVVIEKVERPATIYISVPETSEFMTHDGMEMSNKKLASLFKTSLFTAIGVQGTGLMKIKSKVRYGEKWDSFKREYSITVTINSLLGRE